jgi:hypothetical protein
MTEELSQPSSSSRHDDEALERAVLSRALDLRPERLTIGEMVRELAGEQQAGEQLRGAVERAARGLADAQLIHLAPLDQQELVELTRSAIRLQELLEG